MRKLFLKIHLWLSIPLGIIIFVICLSGSILVFQDEINEWTYSEKYFAKEVETEPMPIGKLVKIVNSNLENNSVTSVQIPSDASRNYVMWLKDGNRASVFVNPYTGEITGKSERGEGFFSVILRLHRWLLGDSKSIGKPIVGYTTLFFVIILVTGIVIWWPRTRKQLKMRLQIKTKYGWKRFWSDLHVSGGIYLLIGLLVLSLTGLYYSFDWYRKGLYSVLGVEMTDHHNQRQQGASERRTGNNPHYENAEDDTQSNPRGRGQTPNYANNDSIHPRHREGKPNRSGGKPSYVKDSLQAKGNTVQDQVKSNDSEQGRTDTQSNPRGRGQNPNYANNDSIHPRHREGKPNRSGGKPSYVKDSLQAKGNTVQDQVEGNDSEQDGTERPDYSDNPRGRGQNPNYANKTDSVHPRHQEGKPNSSAGKPSYAKDSPQIKKNAVQDRAKGNDSEQDRTERPDYSEDVFGKRSNSMFVWQTVFSELVKKNPDFKTITIQNGSASVVQNFTFGNSRASDKFTFDSETGEITKVQLYNDQDGATKVRGWIFSLHTGTWGGLFSKILTCIISLIGASLPITGYYMYWEKRRRKKKDV